MVPSFTRYGTPALMKLNTFMQCGGLH